MMWSPACAGLLAVTRPPSLAKSAAAYVVPFSRYVNKPGDTGARFVDTTAVPWLVATTRSTGPVTVSGGASTLICDGLTKLGYAALPLMVTEAPPSVVGSLPFWIAELQSAVVSARF